MIGLPRNPLVRNKRSAPAGPHLPVCHIFRVQHPTTQCLAKTEDQTTQLAYMFCLYPHLHSQHSALQHPSQASRDFLGVFFLLFLWGPGLDSEDVKMLPGAFPLAMTVAVSSLLLRAAQTWDSYPSSFVSFLYITLQSSPPYTLQIRCTCFTQHNPAQSPGIYPQKHQALILATATFITTPVSSLPNFQLPVPIPSGLCPAEYAHSLPPRLLRITRNSTTTYFSH